MTVESDKDLAGQPRPEMNDEELLALMRSFDDPVYTEAPPTFDRVRAERKFAALVGEILLEFGLVGRCETGVYIQDASFHGSISVPFGSGRGQPLPKILVSNFGDLATVFDEGGILTTKTLAEVVAVLEDSGYTYVPERLLRLPYTGTSPGLIQTWAHRYFDWI